MIGCASGNDNAIASNITWVDVDNPCQKQTQSVTLKKLVREITRVNFLPVKTFVILFLLLGQIREGDQEVLFSLLLLPRKRLKLKNKIDHFKE